MRVRYEAYCGGRLLKVYEQVDVSAPGSATDVADGTEFVDGQHFWKVDEQRVADDVAQAMLVGPRAAMSDLVAFLRARLSMPKIRVKAEGVIEALGGTSPEALVGRTIPVPLEDGVLEFRISEYLFQEDAFAVTPPGAAR